MMTMALVYMYNYFIDDVILTCRQLTVSLHACTFVECLHDVLATHYHVCI